MYCERVKYVTIVNGKCVCLQRERKRAKTTLNKGLFCCIAINKYVVKQSTNRVEKQKIATKDIISKNKSSTWLNNQFNSDYY